MQVSVEKISELSRKMTISVPEEVVQEKMEARFKTLAREVKLDGFRPGKVPSKVVKKLYTDQVRSEVTGDLIQSTYYEALKEQELNPAGHPHIHPSDEQGDFVYTAEFEIYPDVTLTGIERLEVEQPVVEITDHDLDNMIEKLRMQKKEWQEVSRTAQDKDRITINFAGVSEGENFTDGKVEDYQVELGAKKMIPGFEENLIGLEANAKKVFTVSFPDDYGNEKLAGKDAEFDVEVKKVEDSKTPELDTEFIKNYGVQDGKIESFKTDVKNNMHRELEQAVTNKVKNTVMDLLFTNIEMPLPKAMIDQEIDGLMKPYQDQAKQQNLKVEDLNIPRETFEEQAKKRVALGLILSEIIKQNNIKASSDKVRSVIEKMANSYEKPEEVINWYYADQSRLTEVEQMVLEEEAVTWVLSQVKVTDKPAKFDELINPEKKEN